MDDPKEISGKVRESAGHLKSLMEKVVKIEEEKFKDMYELFKTTTNDYWLDTSGHKVPTWAFVAAGVVIFCAGVVVDRMVLAF